MCAPVPRQRGRRLVALLGYEAHNRFDSAIYNLKLRGRAGTVAFGGRAC